MAAIVFPPKFTGGFIDPADIRVVQKLKFLNKFSLAGPSF
jgi:hypothetical protein